MSEWISVVDRLPGSGIVLGYDAKAQKVEHMYRLTWFVGGEEPAWWVNQSGGQPVTHWRPFPKPPKTQIGPDNI